MISFVIALLEILSFIQNSINILGNNFKPTGIIGSSKYGSQGYFSKENLKNVNISESDKSKLTDFAQHSLAQSTWSNYRTAENMLKKCQECKNTEFNWPISQENIIVFISWLLIDKNLSADTARNYLSGVRHAHIMKGFSEPQLRPDLVNFILRGKKNKEVVTKSTKAIRLPATINVMKLLKEEIRIWEKPLEYRLMFWTACTLMFNGAFRGGELLSQHEATFDPKHTLLTKDVEILTTKHGKLLIVTLKNSKENKTGIPVIIEVYETGGPLCPLRAWERWQKSNIGNKNLPLFRDKSGTPLTVRKLNEHLKSLMSKHIPENTGTISSHSFRIGLATILGEKGFADKEIKLAGRWSSRVFATYCKLPRVQRAEIARQIGSL